MRSENEWWNDVISQDKSIMPQSACDSLPVICDSWRYPNTYYSAPISSQIKPILFCKSSQYPMFSNENKIYWVKFTVIFDQRRKKRNVLLDFYPYYWFGG